MCFVTQRDAMSCEVEMELGGHNMSRVVEELQIEVRIKWCRSSVRHSGSDPTKQCKELEKWHLSVPEDFVYKRDDLG